MAFLLAEHQWKKNNEQLIRAAAFLLQFFIFQIYNLCYGGKHMENKISQYANGFSFLLSKDGGEAVLTFTQNQPCYDTSTGKIDNQAGREVATLV